MRIPGRFTDKRRGYTFKKSTGASGNELERIMRLVEGRALRKHGSFPLKEAHFLLCSGKHRVGDPH